MKLLVLPILLTLVSCANIVPKYTEREIEDGKLAKLTTKDVGLFFLDEFHPSIHAVYDADRNQIARNGYMNTISDMYIKPGSYEIVVHCERNNLYSFPSLVTKVEANNTYELACYISKTEDSFLGKKISEIGANIKNTTNRN